MSDGIGHLRAAGIWREMPFMRGPVGAERLVELRAVVGEQRKECADRRARVLAHPWARTRLKEILYLADANMWNGWVPPRFIAEDSDGINNHAEKYPGGRRKNDSPSRTALIQLLHDIDRHEREQQRALTAEGE